MPAAASARNVRVPLASSQVACSSTVPPMEIWRFQPRNCGAPVGWRSATTRQSCDGTVSSRLSLISPRNSPVQNS